MGWDELQGTHEDPAEEVKRSELRALVVNRSDGHCEWPQHHEHAGNELAHLHSLGMGGNPLKDRDTPANVAWLCRDAARASDGEHGSGGAAQYRQFHIQLLGAAVFDQSPAARAWNRAEALHRHLLSRYPLIDEQA